MAVSAVVTLQVQTYTITIVGIAAADTVTINGQVETARTAGAGSHEFNIGSPASDTTAATNLAAVINTDFSGTLTATASSNVVTISGRVTSYAASIAGGTALLAGIGTVNQPATVLVAITNSAGTSVSITDAQLVVTPHGLTYQAVPVNKGNLPIGPGQTVTVPASSTITMQSGVIPYMAPQGQVFLYDIGALITTNNTSPPTVTSATTALLSVTGTVVG